MIPTILLTGFLGAGKTTLLNRLIEHYRSRRMALLINEFGEVGIDGHLLGPGNYHKVELNRGSLFCVCVRTDFIAAVDYIGRKLKPELLLIEATGIADTAEMEKMLALPLLRAHVQLLACICLVDCQSFLKVKEVLRAPISQVRSADLVVINKTDLVPPEQVARVQEAVRAVAPNVRMVTATFADVPIPLLDELRRPMVVSAGAPGEGRREPVFFSHTLQAEGHFSRQGWERFVGSLGPGLMRLKGFISLEGDVVYVDATMARRTLSSTGRPADGQNRLVIIGQGLQPQVIEAAFSRELTGTAPRVPCSSTSDLR